MPPPTGETAVDRKQVPEAARRFDDPWGITWRAINAARRFSLKRTFRFQTARFRTIHHERPVFIIGPPRSGTTTLFHLLSHHPSLGSLWREGHDLWRRYHHPRRNGWKSDRIGAGEVHPAERSFVSRYLYAHFDAPRFVEKTPENCLRIPYLLELFPDARFVFIWRDPRPTISSLINGWRHPEGRFRSYFVPVRLQIPDYSRPHQWCFSLIDGWRDYTTRSIPEIAAEQWRQSARGMMEGKSLIPAGQWRELWLEEYSADPTAQLAPLLDWLDLSNEPALDEFTREGRAVNVMDSEARGDWRRNEAEVLAVLPRLADEIAGAGYDPVTFIHTRKAGT